jgi:radical SAM superfamily enzyme YgiQ (UPF0313 family)
MYLQASLKAAGFEARLIDGSARSEAETLAAVKAFSPDFIGMSCWTIGRKNVFNWIRTLKDAIPAQVMIGGQHASQYPEHFLARGADAVFIGEAERTLPQFIEAFPDPERLAAVPGCAFRLPDGIQRNPIPSEPIKNLDALPMPCYDDIDPCNYSGLNADEKRCTMAGLITSRGCPYACSFCSSSFYWKRRITYRHPKKVIEEIRYLVENLGYRNLIFYDDNFLNNRGHLTAILTAMIEEDLTVPWAAIGRVNGIDRETAALARRAGCYRLEFGIESGSQSILDRIHKQITVPQIEAAHGAVVAAGIIFRPYLIVGSPGETWDSLDETAQLLARLRVDPEHYFSNVMWLLPGTPMFKEWAAADPSVAAIWERTDDTVYYTAERTLEELAQFQDYLLFHMPGGFAARYAELREELIAVANAGLAGRKVWIEGASEVAEIFSFNRPLLSFILASSLPDADVVLAASLAHGADIKERLLQAGMTLPIETLAKLFASAGRNLDHHRLNLGLRLYRIMKNKLTADLRHLAEVGVVRLVLARDSYLSELVRMLAPAAGGKLNLDDGPADQPPRLVFSDNRESEYRFNDFHYPLNRRRVTAR